MEKVREKGSEKFLTPVSDTFGVSRPTTLAVFLLTVLILLVAVFWFFHSAPPKTITMTAGAPGSVFETNAIRYRQILARSGVTLNILPSQGSLQNLERLNNATYQVDVGFVQGGITNGGARHKLYSLGSVSYQPLMIFCRSRDPVNLLSELKGKKLVVGPAGSGTRTLALALLALNGIEPGGSTVLDDSDSDGAAKSLMAGSVDAIFLMGESASPQVMRRLLLTPDIQILNFSQADGYVRRVSYLNKLELPKGSIDFGNNIPASDVFLIGPTIELLARSELHPALCDLLLEAAQEVHGNASLLKRKGEFPSPLEHDYPISPEAARYYKSGKSFLYRYMPFWLASLLNRFLVAFVPVIVLLIPGLRLLPSVFRLRIKLHLYHWYRALLALDKDLLGTLTPEKRTELLARLDHIEKGVNKMKVPASFADQFYALRGHISFVRNRLVNASQPP